MIIKSAKGYVVGCDCPEYVKRARLYRMPRPCEHMQVAMRAEDEKAAAKPREREGHVRVDQAPYYAAAYEVTLDGVRFVGEVSGDGSVRLTAAEHAGKCADYPLDVLTDDAIAAAKLALAEQAKALAARGSVDMFSLPLARTWRDEAQLALLHAMNPNDRRAREDLVDLKHADAERKIAVAARCAGKVAA